MDEVLAAARRFDEYAGPAAEESVWQRGQMIATPIALFIANRKALKALEEAEYGRQQGH